MSRTFQSRFTLTADDFKVLTEAYNRLTLARRIVRFVAQIMPPLAIVAAVLSAIYLDWEYAVYFGALAALLAFLQYVAAPWQVRRSFAHQRLGDYEVELQADEAGFSSRSELAEGSQKWAAIRHVDDLPEHVILWPNNRIGWIIPKRAFTTAQDADAFAQLAKEKTAGQKL